MRSRRRRSPQPRRSRLNSGGRVGAYERPRQPSGPAVVGQHGVAVRPLLTYARPVTLDELRGVLADIDHELVALVGRRLAVASEIGLEKRRQNLPTRDYRQEREVLERARAATAEHGVPPALAEELPLAIIRSSLTPQ